MAEPFRHIACCLDGSPAGDAALAAAMRMRALGDGRLTLVHVVDPGVEASAGIATDAANDAIEEARLWMERMVALAPPCDGVLLDGNPATTVCAWARESGVDLLVVVRHRGRMEHLLVGSVAQHLAYHAPCPVMLVRPPLAAG